MQSVTKMKLSSKQIIKMVREAFGKNKELKDILELTDGYFNSAYMIQFKNRKKAVLKVSPLKDTKVMSYEKNIMKTEAYVLKKLYKIKDVPVPKILHYGDKSKVIENEFIFMEYINGVPLNKIRKHISENQYRSLSSNLGKIVKKINGIKGEYFGYISQENKRFTTWSEAFLCMIKELLDDAQDMDITLPYGKTKLYNMIGKQQDVLDRVKEPSLVHKDLWEGNIFIDPDKVSITGIVDCERALFGDPLLEPVCGFILESESFMKTFIGRITLNRDEYIRTILYRVYLCLIMVIECYYRKYPDGNSEERARSNLDGVLQILLKL